METWPAAFPAPSTNFGADVGPSTVRTGMDSGRVRQRRRFTTEDVSVSVRWELSDIEMGVFVAFHKWKLNLGADYFIINLPLGGQGLVPHVARFKDGKFNQDYEDVGFWKVGATLEVRERIVFDEITLNFYLGIGFSNAELTNLIEAANRFHQCLHVTLPPLLN